MVFFERSGQEDNLAMSCAALSFVVETVEDLDEGKIATGTMVAKDYIEGGIKFTCHWQAKQKPSSTEWTVTAAPGSDDFFKSVTGEILFTANSAVNMSIKEYVAKWLNSYLAGAQSSTEPAQYTGETRPYEGECVCVNLSVSSKVRPFPWDDKTGGAYPQDCFLCSCGTRWYCLDSKEHLWGVVVEPDLWKQLLKYNGVSPEKIAPAEGAYVFRLQTLRDRGFIPFPP